MQRTGYARHLILGLAACGLLTVIVQGGCAESDDIDIGVHDGTGGLQGTRRAVTRSRGGSVGSGGSNGTGGISATGGTTATGGTVGTGGVNATGGTVGTGGTRATGGTVGTGGTVATGGMTGAGGTRATGGTMGTGGAGGAAATFTQVYQMVLTPKCAGSACHIPGSQGGVSFSSQSTAYNAVKGRVSAGNANGSSFYTLLTSGSMPRGQAKLSTTLLNLVAAWINAGALNN